MQGTSPKAGGAAGGATAGTPKPGGSSPGRPAGGGHQKQELGSKSKTCGGAGGSEGGPSGGPVKRGGKWVQYVKGGECKPKKSAGGSGSAAKAAKGVLPVSEPRLSKSKAAAADAAGEELAKKFSKKNKPAKVHTPAPDEVKSTLGAPKPGQTMNDPAYHAMIKAGFEKNKGTHIYKGGPADPPAPPKETPAEAPPPSDTTPKPKDLAAQELLVDLQMLLDSLPR